MQVTWTGAEATELRRALGVTQSKFSKITGVGVPTIKKWAQRGAWVTLSEDFARIMDTTLARATAEQKAQFAAAIGLGVKSPATSAGAVWNNSPSADCATATAELTRKDLTMDRRHATQAILGVAVGAGLLETMEQWLFFEDAPRQVEKPTGLGMQEVEQLENVARSFRDWDDQFGGGLRRKAVVGQLAEVNEMLRERQPVRVEKRLWGVLAQLAETAATMSWDSGQQATAQQYYALAARAASHADDPAFCGFALAGMARQLLGLDGDAGAADALELVRLARDRGAGALTPTVEAMLYTREAWAMSKLERPSGFRRACEKAKERFAASQTATDPFWVHYFDSAELAGTIGGRLLDMSRRKPVFAGEAAEHIELAVQSRRPDRIRSTALDRLGLAEARVIQGEMEEACRVGHDALDVVERTRSDRVRVKVGKLYKRTERAQGNVAVAELRDRMRPLVNAQE
ncbi:hypothetical protein NLM24_13330 [Nocardia zapadnayensis]|uniref:hypothetical protein n=1 Tax=Nocardia rhamnosiphila TaxID=426716 RepID=UPI0022470943|nr:hypothetical protein [Nocardia zapadnayensis]MCX0271673.1 hypothetical protein [Nocardia zapadnayensis]